MLTPADIRRLQMLVTVADYHGDAALYKKLTTMLDREESRALLNRTDEHGKELPVDGIRRSS